MDVISTDFENWGPYLMKQFQQMYDKGERCDLEISCNKQIFLVHRLILSACSEYVRDLGDKQHIILPDEVSCKALKSIIDFVYTGKIIFCKDEKEDLLLASNLLNMRLLTELIKMEESCSFTLSIDDENEEPKGGENTNDNLNLDLNESTDLVADDKSAEPSATSPNVKKKETRCGRPRGSKSAVLPPLFKFPYLHQKFSSSRTYGLITILTDLVPSRLDIPESIIQSCPFQSSFDDVTYETSILCSYESMDAPLQPIHHQFLKKLKESPQKRTFASALFSPFDKYTPPYNMSSEMHASKKRESVSSSYLSNIDMPAYKRPTPKTSQTPKKSVTFAKELEVIVECPRSYSEPRDSPKAVEVDPLMTPIETSNPILEAPETSTAAIDDTLETNDIDMELPAPLSPVTNISDDLIPASFVGSGEKIELTNLKNVAMPMEIDELEHPSVIEYQSEPSVTTVNTLAINVLRQSVPTNENLTVPTNENLTTCEDVTMMDAADGKTIPKDVSVLTDNGKSLANENSTATSHEFSVVEEVLQEVQTQQQNLAVAALLETPDVTAAEAPLVKKTLTVTNKNETEIELMPDSHNESSNVNSSELTLVTSETGIAKQISFTTDVATKTYLKKVPADTSSSGDTHQNLTAVTSASEITQQNLPKHDDISEVSGEKLLSDVVGTKHNEPLSIERVTAQHQSPTATNSIEITQHIALTTTSVTVTTTELSFSSLNTSTTTVISTPNAEMPNVSSSVVSIQSSETDILPSIVEKPNDHDNLISVPSTSNSDSNSINKLKLVNSIENSEDLFLSDSTIFTAIDKKSVSQISTDPNSQIFALKVKGTENPTQLSHLVDLCKNNPLFKNKNVKFKIVPVKGTISKTLQEQPQLSSKMLNKAIIVQRQSSNTQDEGANVQGVNTSATAPATKSTAIRRGATKTTSMAANRKHGKIPSVENINGPWECNSCSEKDSSSPLKLNSYFEYRTHSHEVHGEPNNPIFCMHCGYKSLKRNQQLFHLLTKHQIQPPSNIQFPKCDKCNVFALNDYFLQKHLSTHQSSGMEYVCSCKAAFKTSELLQQHMASNDCKTSGSFSCGYCNTQFSRFVNLKAHMRLCMKERSKPMPLSTPFIDPVRPPLKEDFETILP